MQYVVTLGVCIGGLVILVVLSKLVLSTRIWYQTDPYWPMLHWLNLHVISVCVAASGAICLIVTIYYLFRAFRQIVEAFARGDDDILVGTQMITKGFDFGGVELVGVLNADNLLNNPDFRSAERAFQLLMQVAGRAGRRENPGTVVIQTAEPGHPVLQQVIAGDYEAMARQQLAERKAFFYPPYARLLNLLLRHRDPVTVSYTHLTLPTIA